MPPGYTKGDIQFHIGTRAFGPRVPAVNVKVYDYADTLALAKEFSRSEAEIDKALRLVDDTSKEWFWNVAIHQFAEMHLIPVFGESVSVSSAGYSSGWVVAEGIGYEYDVMEDWDAIDLTSWYSFQRAVRAAVAWLTSPNYVRDEVAQVLGKKGG